MKEPVVGKAKKITIGLKNSNDTVLTFSYETHGFSIIR